MEPFTKGELVMLNRRSIRAKHQCKKLEDKIHGPFKVIATGKNRRYCTIKLPESWQIDLTFNISLLEQY